MDVRSLIQEYLSKAQIMQIATSHSNQPWISTVYFAIDIDLNIYWLSRESRRHSQEIAKNSKVAANIFLPNAYGEKVRGLQVEGSARQLTDGEADQGVNIYKSKFWIVEDRSRSLVEGGDPQTCYQLKPSSYFLYDEVNFPENPQQVLKL